MGPAASKPAPPPGLRAYSVLWGGQVASLLGAGIVDFGLSIWAWELTGRATALALVGFFAFGPTILLSPLAGVAVDRWNRKVGLILPDIAMIAAAGAFLILQWLDLIGLWQVYVLLIFAGSFQAFKFPAYSAATTVMVEKRHYGRASGMLSTAQSMSTVVAPVLAVGAYAAVGIGGVMAMDIVASMLAIIIVLIVRIPRPPRTEAGKKAEGSIWKQSAFGFRYIWERPSLLGLPLLLFTVNVVSLLGYTVIRPMILARTLDDKALLGLIYSIGGVGGVAGGVLMSVWGGPKRRVVGLVVSLALCDAFGGLLVGLGRSFLPWAAGMFLSTFFMPIANGCNQAIWLSKVGPDVQGRVFATRMLIATMGIPISMLLAGPLADYVFEPGMAAGGALAGTFGWLVGTGRGTGMSLMLVIVGIASAVVAVVAYSVRSIRDAEAILPDFKPLVTATEGTSGAGEAGGDGAVPSACGEASAPTCPEGPRVPPPG